MPRPGIAQGSAMFPCVIFEVAGFRFPSPFDVAEYGRFSSPYAGVTIESEM
jgi:hypothetical protein